MAGCGCGEEGVTRRSFLAWAAGGLGAIIAAVLGAAGGGYFLSPAFSKEEEGWIDAGSVSDLRPGRPTKVDFVARKREAWVVTEKRASAWIVSDGKTVTAFDPRCTHLGCPYRWDEAKGQFLCPCHAGGFAVSGAVVSGPPPRALDRYGVKIADGRLLIQPKAQKA